MFSWRIKKNINTFGLKKYLIKSYDKCTRSTYEYLEFLLFSSCKLVSNCKQDSCTGLQAALQPLKNRIVDCINPKVLITTAADNILMIFFFFFFQRNKAWHFMWIVCLSMSLALILLSLLTFLLLNMTCPVLANSVDPVQLASEEANWSGSTLSLNVWISIKNPDQVIWLAGN